MLKPIGFAFLAFGVGLVSVGVDLGLHSGAKAVTTFCASTGTPGFSLDTAPGSPCVGTGDANDINNSVPGTLPGYTLLDKSDNPTDGVAGWKTAISYTGTTGGDFKITPGTGYYDLVLAFRDGRFHEDGYGAFLLGALSGSWAIINPPQGVSHFTLYGKACPGGVCPDNNTDVSLPVPGAIWLFGTVLVGVATLRRRRRNV
jgi:hypothetical protein